MTTAAPLATALRQARINAGLTQAQVAHALGWSSFAVLSGYENGHSKVTAGVIGRVLGAIDRIAAEGAIPPTPHRIKALRRAAGVTQLAVSKDLGFGRGRLSTYESGRVRVTETMERRILDAIARLSQARAGRP